MLTEPFSPRHEKDALADAIHRFQDHWEQGDRMTAFLSLGDAVARAAEVLSVLDAAEALDPATRLQAVQLTILLHTATQTLEALQDTPLAPVSVYPLGERPEPCADALFPAGTILDCPRCGAGLFTVTQDALTSDLVLDDGAVLVPLTTALPARHAWSPLACPLCGARLLSEGRLHTVQYGWRGGQTGGQPHAMGERIAAVRRQAGLTHGQWAALLGESVASIQGYECGHPVPLRVLSTMARKLGVNWVWLETGVGHATD